MKCSHFLASTTNWLKHEANLTQILLLESYSKELPIWIKRAIKKMAEPLKRTLP
jgi:hypothetical protein